MAISISQWKTEFLKSHNLEQVTGQPLYSYKMSSQEFADLEALLRERLASFLNHASLSDLSRFLPPFPSLFVIYASEWWRRKYDGSGWAWEPILDSLGLPSDEWSQGERSTCVEKGLKEWGLKLVDSRGLRYLGSIAFQGGLPMQLLATARGNIGRVLTKVLKIAATGNFEASDIQDWIRSLSSDLPKAYRQNEIYVLLAEVVLSVLRLIRDANLKSANGAIEILDKSIPNWRNTFPLPIEDEQAQGLIDQLIRDAANVRISKSIRKLYVERWLENVDDHWELQSSISLPDYLDFSEIKTQFKLDDFSLSGGLIFRFSRGNKNTEISLRKLAGQDRYKLEQKPIEVHDISVAAEHSISLISAEGEVFHSTIPKGNVMSANLPWLFEVSDSNEKFSLFRQGAGSIISSEAVICIPQEWKISTDIGNEAVNLGLLILHDRTIWKVSGNATITDLNNNNFRVRCGQASATEDVLELRGTRIWEIFSRPTLAFSGIPKLFNVSENGLDHPVNGSIGWRSPSGVISDKYNGINGPIDAFWPASGEIKWHSRFVQLPENAKFGIEPGQIPTVGRLRFSNWGLVGAQVENADIRTDLTRVGADLFLNLEYVGSGSPPECCEIKVLWPNNTLEACLNIPFPSKGVRAVDANGTQLANKHQIPISDILGIRLIGFLGGAKRAELTISLHNAHSSNALLSIRKLIKSNKDQNHIEIRLIDYANEINKLLAGIDTLDATVNFKLEISGSPAFTLRVAKYACELTRLPSLPGVELPLKIFEKLSASDITKITIDTLRLDAPGDEPIKLEPSYSQGVATGSWTLPNRLTPGPWMIYPQEDSSLIFRPLIWSIAEETKNNDEYQDIEVSLSKALKISNEHERNELLIKVVNKLSDDFLDDDWLLVEQLATNLGHLPLSTLDLWRSFTHSTKAMAALAMRLGNFQANFVDRFSTELPWMWETISLEAWANAIHLLLNQCETNCGREAGRIVFDNYVDRRVQDIPTLNPALRILLEIAKTQVSGITTDDIAILQNLFMEKINSDLLFSGENSRLQRLLRNNYESDWPNNFSEVVAKFRQGEFASFLCSEDYDKRNTVINIPIALAISSVMNVNLNSFEDADFMSKLRIMQDFDQDWFSEAFDLTVARCVSSGLIHIKKER